MPIDPNKAMDLLKRLQLNQEYQLKSGTPEQFDAVDSQIERVGRVLEGGNKAQEIGMPAQPQEAGGPPVSMDDVLRADEDSHLDEQAKRLQRGPSDVPIPGTPAYMPLGKVADDGMDAVLDEASRPKEYPWTTPSAMAPWMKEKTPGLVPAIPWERKATMPKQERQVDVQAEAIPTDPLTPEGDPESKAIQMQLDQLGIEPRLAQRVYQGRKFNNPEDVEAYLAIEDEEDMRRLFGSSKDGSHKRPSLFSFENLILALFAGVPAVMQKYVQEKGRYSEMAQQVYNRNKSRLHGTLVKDAEMGQAATLKRESLKNALDSRKMMLAGKQQRKNDPLLMELAAADKADYQIVVNATKDRGDRQKMSFDKTALAKLNADLEAAQARIAKRSEFRKLRNEELDREGK